MLQHLTIRDFVIVDRLELSFLAGFGALTGETGAGKSILIDALALALGERADAAVVRSGCDKAEVAATFDIAGLPQVGEWLSASSRCAKSANGWSISTASMPISRCCVRKPNARCSIRTPA